MQKKKISNIKKYDTFVRKNTKQFNFYKNIMQISFEKEQKSVQISINF